MITLGSILLKRGYSYKSFLGIRAEDIDFDNINDLCYSIGYILRNVQRIDAEIPKELESEILRAMPNYIINSGSTSGGNAMKWGKEYRIYFSSTKDMPTKLQRRLQNDKKMRMTGSKFIEACFYLGFSPGSDQDIDLICENMKKIFNDTEVEYFYKGYKGQ